MRVITILTIAALLAGTAAAQKVRVTGAHGASLEDIAGTPTLVTVVLKGSGARDSNLRVKEILPTHFNVLTTNNTPIPYVYEDVEEIQIQGEVVEKSAFRLATTRTLREEEQKIVSRAWERTLDVYENSNREQALKIRAATILSLSPAMETAAAAREYLSGLAESNDLRTQLDAARGLYLIGDELPENVLRLGLQRGNRAIQITAAVLSGLSGFLDAVPQLNGMLDDRVDVLAVPAAYALARLGQRDIIPKLLEMLGSIDVEKGKAAVFALSRLGGDDVIEQVLYRAEAASGMERYYAALILYNLGDPEGRKQLKKLFKDQPTLRSDIALLLAKEDDWDATQYLRSRLDRSEDDTELNLLFRAENAASLLINDDPHGLATFQELLRQDSTRTPALDMRLKRTVCRLVTEVGKRNLLAIIQPTMEATNGMVALSACEAAVSLALPEFRERLTEWRK